MCPQSFVNKLFQKIFNITFAKNIIKNCQKLNYFLFVYKKFLNKCLNKRMLTKSNLLRNITNYDYISLSHIYIYIYIYIYKRGKCNFDVEKAKDAS